MKYFFVIYLLCFAVEAFGQHKGQHYQIYNTATGKISSVDDIVTDMAKADVLFFGEEHNDSTAHYLEFTILKKLIEVYPGNIALSMEMFETDTQPIVNEYLRGLIREKNFMTDARAWPNYTKDYRPIVELAKANQVDIIAANAPARYTNMVTRLGLFGLDRLDATGKAHLPPLPIDTATGKYYEKFTNLMGGHGMPGMQIYQAQNLWDATMGWSIAQYIKAHSGIKVFQMNGGFHSEEKLGIVAQFKKYSSKARVLNIASVSGTDITQPDWSKYANLADYIILTDFKAQE